MFDRTADWYDLLYSAQGHDYASASEIITALVRQRCPAAASLLDVACGTGGHLQHLAEKFEVAGVDLDPGMIAAARARLPDDVPLAVADMRDLDLGRQFDAVTCLFSSIGYADTREDLDRAVASMARHLRPGGVLLVEGWVLPEHWRDGHVGALAAAEPGRGVGRVNISWREGDVTVLEMHYLLGEPGTVRHVVEEHRVRLHSRQDYIDAFAAAGLKDVVVDDTALTGRGLYIGSAPV